jgi:hypothetical protein
MISSEDREEAVLKTLESLPKENIILIGGYAVNAYVPPRFSIDCDLVVLREGKEVETLLQKQGFKKIKIEIKAPSSIDGYTRYNRGAEKVAFDLLFGSVLDRQTGISFEAQLFENRSATRTTLGRISTTRITMKIANPELLIAMKFVSGRKQDVRDIFMLAGTKLNWNEVQELISKKCSPKLIAKRTKEFRKIAVDSPEYRDNLQGPYGKMPDETFNSLVAKFGNFLTDLERLS